MATITQEEMAPAARRVQFARQTLVFTLLLMLLVVAFTVSLCVGRFSVPAGRALELIWQGISDPSRELTAIDERIVLLVRAPRVVLAALAGAGLAISGAGLQGCFEIRLFRQTYWAFPRVPPSAARWRSCSASGDFR